MADRAANKARERYKGNRYPHFRYNEERVVLFADKMHVIGDARDEVKRISERRLFDAWCLKARQGEIPASHPAEVRALIRHVRRRREESALKFGADAMAADSFAARLHAPGARRQLPALPVRQARGRPPLHALRCDVALFRPARASTRDCAAAGRVLARVVIPWPAYGSRRSRQAPTRCMRQRCTCC